MAWFTKKEARAQEPQRETNDDPVLNALLGTTATTKEMALQIPTIAGAIDLIGNVIAGTPIRLYVETDGKAQEVKGDKRVSLLNDETGDTLNSNEFWKAITRDYYTGKGGYAYISKEKGNIKALHYVDEANISIRKNFEPIFKDFDIIVNGVSYKPYEFLKVLRNTKDGAIGIPITKENSKLISVAYNSLVFEQNMSKRGGNKKGFLKSEKKLEESALTTLKTAFTKLYSSDGEGSDNFVLLNNGIDFKESSNTSVELQLNENKLTNAQEASKLFHISTDVISGKAEDTGGLAKLAAIPLMQTIQCALNKDLLLEKEKGKFYFAFDTKELLKGDIQQRFNAYKTALDGNFMQIDEVRFAEDLKPLGLNWIKLGLQDVLYNPETKEIFTPNTGKSAHIDDEILQSGLQDDTLEARAQPRDKNGKFASSGGSRHKTNTKYAPTKSGKTNGIKLGYKEYGKLSGAITTKYGDTLKPGDLNKNARSANYGYVFNVGNEGQYIITKKAKIK